MSKRTKAKLLVTAWFLLMALGVLISFITGEPNWISLTFIVMLYPMLKMLFTALVDIIEYDY